MGYRRLLPPLGPTSLPHFSQKLITICIIFLGGVGYIKDAPYDEHCAHCDNEIAAGDLVVAAPKFVESVMWHPKCFTCSTCNSLLVDLTYCVHDDKIYCERHYAEMLKPRCAGCDEVSTVPQCPLSFKLLLRSLIENYFVAYFGAHSADSICMCVWR